MRERERAAFIRSPKCKSSRGVNHVALRLKTVGVINHLGRERRIFSAFHRVAVYITLRHFFYYFYASCENQYFSATHRIFTTACNCLPLQFSQFSPSVFYENSRPSIWLFHYLPLYIFRSPIILSTSEKIFIILNNVIFFFKPAIFLAHSINNRPK